jgi:carboxyl-terminal processing protease
LALNRCTLSRWSKGSTLLTELLSAYWRINEAFRLSAVQPRGRLIVFMCASRHLLHIAIVAIVSGCLLLGTAAQNITFKREEAELIVDEVANDVAKHYYDPKLHGVDWNAQLREAKEKIRNATSSNLAYANIAAMLDSLNDSHTFFIPRHPFSLDYGWRMQAIGERCFVTRVRPETDAAGKLHPGDEVMAINDYKPARANITRIEYVLNTLRPQSKIAVTVRSIAGQEHQFDIAPKIFEGQLISPTLGDMRNYWEAEHRYIRPRVISLNSDVLVAKIPIFAFDEAEVDKLATAAREHKAVILDLRGNSGGREESLRMLASRFLDHEVKIADAVTRDGTKTRFAKPDHHTFSGKLIVLVDSRSASAAELFARVVQIEKRGAVMGDRTLGMVMESQMYGLASSGYAFGVSITGANLIMSDGNSLEHVGVIPDELVLPTVDDIANGRDSVLAHAAEIAGAKLSPEDAAKLFPYEWQQRYYFAGH